jgi:DNA-directed RNA polymerase subunit RPC12/RpoP
MRKRTYYYCVQCGRRLELRDEIELRARRAG